jgi:hypothetical protein
MAMRFKLYPNELPHTSGKAMKTTSRLYDDLYKLLGQSDWVDRRHLQTLVWMLLGLLCSGCVSLTRWTAYINSRATRAQSYQRRLSRWLHNPRLTIRRGSV